ncbi:PQQ-binding-like beta-propeller repeat protein [Natronorubrum sulfidifaciens]|uniref:Pyrrolo-quinoline quinone n=1 Tax=Natronorubrum sulfidifaciens JCM 14089 TaxID=1230460 RepID=L9W667_9EURY|nr:PQQ-binding-like beta-propeller repeat protein [Natronorubrum sulfidifaciens]ELY43828.1 pyrrolo-quinoline quinone [Natronorubrum sulfidifaciens JCM 14089]
MPSRRWLLAGASATLAGLIGGHAVADQAGTEAVDWPMARYDAAGTGHNPNTTGPRDDVQIAWDRDLAASARGVLPPILHTDTLYVVGGAVTALEAETGTVEFTRDGDYQSSPARADADVYRTDTLAVSSPDGLAGLNAGGGIDLPLLGSQFGLERWDGPSEVSRSSIFGPPNAPPPIAVDDTIYAAVPGTNHLVALAANDGTERWRTVHGAGSGLYRPAVRDGIVYAVDYAHELGAYDAETGERRWLEEIDDRPPYAPTATDEGVVVPGRESVTCLDADEGRIRWTYDHDGNVSDADRAAAAVANGRVFVVDSVGSLHAIDLESGEAVWTAAFGGVASPVVADGVVYVTRRTVGLDAFDAATGEHRWTFDVEWPTSAPIVSGGRLYVVQNRRVLALEEADR